MSAIALENSVQQENGKQQETILRYQAAADFLGLPIGSLYFAVHAKTIPHYRCGPRTVLFRKSELAAWLAKRAVPVVGGAR